MDKWLMVVIGWGIVGPILAIGVCYVISWRMGNVSWRPGCRLSGSRHCLHLHHWRLLTKTDRRHGTSDAVKSLLPRRTWPMHLRRREPLVTDIGRAEKRRRAIQNVTGRFFRPRNVEDSRHSRVEVASPSPGMRRRSVPMAI